MNKILHAWASTTPHEDGKGTPGVDDACAVEGCPHLLVGDEECYAVIEIDRKPYQRQPWVCWRHVNDYSDTEQLMTGPVKVGA